VVKTFESHLGGKSEEEVELVGRKAIERYEERTYRYTRDLIKELKPTHRLIAISFSPKEIVEPYNDNYLHFDKVFSTAHEVVDGLYTGKPNERRYEEKASLLMNYVDEFGLEWENSYGVGDTEGDIELLGMVKHPIAFNPNQRLYTHAKERNWQVIVERKDVIYKL
jgi:phosphoserine phosphatase